MAEINKGGRPKGAKDAKPRKRRPKKGVNPWDVKTKDPRSNTNKRLLLDQLKRYDFDVIQEVLWLYDQLKGQMQIFEVQTPEGQEELKIKIYPKDITAQMLDILKLLVSHAFPKMKALELKGAGDAPITLNFNVGGPQEGPKKVEIEKVEEEKEKAIDMVYGPGGIHLPVKKGE